MYGESVLRSFTIIMLKKGWLTHMSLIFLQTFGPPWLMMMVIWCIIILLQLESKFTKNINIIKWIVAIIKLLNLLIGLNSRDSLINRKDIYRTTQFKLVHLKINSLSETTYLVSITMFLPLILSDPFNDWNVMCSFDRKSILYLVYSYVFRISPQR